MNRLKIYLGTFAKGLEGILASAVWQLVRQCAVWERVNEEIRNYIEQEMHLSGE